MPELEAGVGPGVRSPLATARVAGVLYLVIIVLGLFTELYVRGRLIVPDDPGATAAAILGAQGLFRLGFLTDSLVFLSDAAVAVLFYVLLKPVNVTLALAAAAFRLTQTSVLALNLLNQHAALIVLTGGAYTGLTSEERDGLAYLMLDRHGYGYDLGLLFFGVHCLLLGLLIARSKLFPKLLGVLLTGASFAYLVGSYTRFLFPSHVDTVAPIYVLAIVAEVAMCAWLLVKGIDVREWQRLALR